MDDYFEYQYPNNLNEKLMFYAWTVPELLLIGFGAILTLFISMKIRNVFPLVLDIGVGIFMAHFDERSTFQHLYDWFKFLFTPRTWQYIPNAKVAINIETNEETKKKTTQKKEKKFILPIVLVIILVALMVWAFFPSSSKPSFESMPTETPNEQTDIETETPEPETTAEATATPISDEDSIAEVSVNFNEDTITASQGAEINYSGNVAIQQGSYTYTESLTGALENGQYYIDTSMVNTNEIGEYPVTVYVKDLNGIESTKSFTVNIIQ